MGFSIPPITLALAAALLVAAPISFLAARRGGRFRGLPGWMGFWAFFAPLLVFLSRANRLISFPLLAVLMFAALKEYFFLAPLRPRDRWAILLAYLSIPCALYLAFVGPQFLFLTGVPMGFLLFLPALLALGSRQAGLLESIGRLLLGVAVFVFCTAHLGLLGPRFYAGALELFGVLVLSAELPQRLAGRTRLGENIGRPLIGMLSGIGLAAGMGAALGPLAGLGRTQGSVAGVLVAAGVSAGALVADAVAQDLALGTLAARVGRGAFLDRTMPAVYSAPLYFHYLNHWKGLP